MFAESSSGWVLLHIKDGLVLLGFSPVRIHGPTDQPGEAVTDDDDDKIRADQSLCQEKCPQIDWNIYLLMI